MKLTAYHVTDKESAPKILSEGFRLDVPSRRDPGDLGQAIYLTTSLERARAMGGVVLTVEVEPRNAIHMDAEMAYAYVIDALGFDAVRGHGDWDTRPEEARRAREHFLREGLDAFVMKRDQGDLEIAVYDLAAIKSVKAGVA